jgi:RNA polymerase sigma-70 factor, ECF subfamily
MTETGVDVFESHRHHMFAVAYRMLGSVNEAEDAVQETWIRWAAADRDSIESARGWLTTVTGRLCVDRLRSAQKRRETYVGPWLPEPLIQADDDPAEHAALADSLSLAFLELLERLDPVERAAFLLREVFAEDYADVAAAIDRSEVACRQIVHRAKERLGPDRPVRFDPGPDEERRLVDSFFAAAFSGDLDALHAVLCDDVVVWSDGGAARHAARRPVIGAHRVGIFVTGIARRGAELGTDVALRHVRVNGEPGMALFVADGLDQVLAFELAPGGIQGIRIVLNPEKLDHLRAHRWDG